MNLSSLKRDSVISVATSTIFLKLSEYCTENIIFNGQEYKGIDFMVLPNSCTDIILGVPFLKMHWSITISYGGSQDILKICVLTKTSCAPIKLFQNLTPNCKPIATKSQNDSAEDTQFIRKEILQLLEDDIIEPSYSMWHTQIVVTSTPNKKKRMVVDFSHTINHLTLLDAYPLPQIKDLVNQIAQYRIFSIIDLSKAYYQIEICPKDRPYTAFQTGNHLYQFKWIPMVVTNGGFYISTFYEFFYLR